MLRAVWGTFVGRADSLASIYYAMGRAAKEVW